MSRFFTTNPTGVLDACYCRCLRPHEGGLATLEMGRSIPHAAPACSADRKCPDCHGFGFHPAEAADYAGEIRRLKAEVSIVAAEAIANEAEARALRAENDTLRAEKDRLFAAVWASDLEAIARGKGWREEIDRNGALRAENDTLKAELSHATAEADRLHSQLDAAFVAFGEARGEIQSMKARLDQAEEIERIRRAFVRKDRPA